MQERAKRNLGCAFDADWVASVRVNRSAVERRADTLTKRRTVKKDWQAAWLLRAISCMDLTTLAGDDTSNALGPLANPRAYAEQMGAYRRRARRLGRRSCRKPAPRPGQRR